jgi:hypothetical protein
MGSWISSGRNQKQRRGSGLTIKNFIRHVGYRPTTRVPSLRFARPILVFQSPCHALRELQSRLLCLEYCEIAKVISWRDCELKWPINSEGRSWSIRGWSRHVGRKGGFDERWLGGTEMRLWCNQHSGYLRATYLQYIEFGGAVPGVESSTGNDEEVKLPAQYIKGYFTYEHEYIPKFRRRDLADPRCHTGCWGASERSIPRSLWHFRPLCRAFAEVVWGEG